MHIIIPMSGFGERFRRAGYTVPKPLIQVEGKPIIAHVIDLFPGETKFTFICNRDHLAAPAFRMREILEQLCPTGEIVGIEPHKLGPVNAVAKIAHRLDPDEPVIVNYCDFACYWDYPAFKAMVEQTACDGAIACYRGFHPHMLGSVNYAYVREQDGWIQDIQEKQPYTDRPMEEYASSGTYYFRSGALVQEYFARAMRPDLALNGEYYVSLAYKPMLEDNRRIAVFPVQHFMQWGTPEDLADYQGVSDIFRRLAIDEQTPARHDGAVMIPMAGLGSRFAREGYLAPKPLIPVSGRPMAAQAAADLPHAPQRIFILRRDLPEIDRITASLQQEFPDCRLVMLDAMTDGQARTCLMGLDSVDLTKPLTIGACDSGVLYDSGAFDALMVDPATDVIVWGARDHPGAARHPHMYGWIAADGNRVTGVSVKTPLRDPSQDPIVIGAFTFKRAGDFAASAERLIARGGRVNDELYVDSCINDALALGLSVRLFEVDSYLCWGTPDDLRRYEYWQECFDKWNSHIYQREFDQDFRVPALEDK